MEAIVRNPVVKRIGLYVLLLAAVAVIGVLMYRDPLTQSTIASLSPSGNVQDGYAQAFCDGDAEYLATYSGGPLAAPLETWQEIVATGMDWECAGVRYFGVVNNPAGPEYFYALSLEGYELWYAFTVVDGKVVGIE